MAVTDDILATYRGPGRVARRLLSGERHEARALAYLLAGLIVAYVALWPVLARQNVLAGADEPPRGARLRRARQLLRRPDRAFLGLPRRHAADAPARARRRARRAGAGARGGERPRLRGLPLVLARRARGRRGGGRGMTGLPALVADLARQTMRDPRGGVRRLLALDLPMEARWIALLLVTVLAVLVTRLSLV